MISFKLMMDPVPKGRARFNPFNNAIYTPAKTKSFESQFRMLANQYRPDFPMSGPVKLSVVFVLKRPKTTNKTRPTAKPDIDNYVKAVADAMNQVFYLDDSQIVKLEAEKIYGVPQIQIHLEEIL